MLGQRLRRWPNIKTPSGEWLVFYDEADNNQDAGSSFSVGPADQSMSPDDKAIEPNVHQQSLVIIFTTPHCPTPYPKGSYTRQGLCPI